MAGGVDEVFQAEAFGEADLGVEVAAGAVEVFGGEGGFGGGGRNAAGENLPGTIMGVIAYQRQALYDARRYGQILDRFGPKVKPDADEVIKAVEAALATATK